MDELANLASFVELSATTSNPDTTPATTARRVESLDVLYEISRELTSILDREELLSRIALRVKRIVDYHVFTVMLWNEATQLLEGVFAMHYENSIPSRFRLPLFRGITGTAAGERRALRVDDVQEDSRYVPGDIGLEVRSELVVPLLLQDRLIGVLDLESTEPRAFTAHHEQLLVTLGSYVAIALENARLYQQARENERRLQNDLDTAREIQLQLLPKGAREVPGLDLAASYLPARELGGDFYDFFPYGEGRLAFALGDVSGKGTAAALFGSLAIGTLREVAAERTLGAAETLAVLNRRMHAARLEAKFIAMLFAIYDAPSRRLTLANAGEPYPLLVRDGQITEISVSGIPLGLFPLGNYDEIVVELQPGDLVVCASDGILESENALDEEFGADRLNALLAAIPGDDHAGTISERILRATDEFAGPGVSPHDDRTLIVLRVTSESAADFSKLPIIY